MDKLSPWERDLYNKQPIIAPDGKTWSVALRISRELAKYFLILMLFIGTEFQQCPICVDFLKHEWIKNVLRDVMFLRNDVCS